MREILAEKLERIKVLVAEDYFVPILIILVGIAAFGLGRLSVIESQKSEPVRIEGVDRSQMEQVSRQEAAAGGAVERSATSTAAGSGSVVASVNSDKYHLPWCSGAQRINDENKIWFDSPQDARDAGYTPAGNCKGLE